MNIKFAVTCISISCAACQVAPSPDEVVPGYNSTNIVRQIRCETRKAVIQKLGAYLLSLDDNPRAQELGTGLISESINPKSIDLTFLPHPEKMIILQFSETAIAYNFSFTGLQSGSLGAGSSTVDGFLSGNKTLGLKADLARSNQSIETFTISDTFSGLIRNVDPEYCEGRQRDANYMYPIAGKIGISKMLDNFANLVEFGGLAAKNGEKPGTPSTHTTNMTFVTTVNASINPVITVSPIVNVTRTGGNLLATAGRTDTHGLIIAFARPVGTPSSSRALRAFGGEIISPTGTETEQRAQLAIQQSIIRYELNNRPNSFIINQTLIPF